ncbi:hypothetical protein DFH94DRAFT_338085 [Russula ochroleuca]|uniref:Uncharacterized protein n=1 Tax=Russula ochroleuca TaxID=152965 RepID=A0A9P5N1V1_9AGAM|nr:hypothetical protein DFH94DRAFT_338085 [Russula ochroleuca]
MASAASPLGHLFLQYTCSPTWYKITENVPPDRKDYERVQFDFDRSCYATIYATNGTPL